ncbi:hypothetical protein CRP01_25505 [Flavilitoribacter nigricans DSM 23189 = NBRC 102662]|uniref:Uncharacterized protein n=2 Tax=Flavilitoribacter TaxID=2762562 RepID=A0A2D0N5E9_FLAN2|nr:hypothetical protein CRP01_25505 [Flavilitoribacter nigricans DSM 23189 = NBRC 102662]
MLLLGLIALSSADCEKKPQTEAEFVEEEILTTGMETRVNGLQDLLYFAAQQDLNACQENCGELEEAVSAAEKEVKAMEDLLLGVIGGIKPPPPPCPCQTGSCLWERLAVFNYFVDVKKYKRLPDISIQTVNGEIISSSADAEIIYSPEGGQFAVVNLPQKEINDDAVNVVISLGDGSTEVLVYLQ